MSKFHIFITGFICGGIFVWWLYDGQTIATNNLLKQLESSKAYKHEEMERHRKKMRITKSKRDRD